MVMSRVVKRVAHVYRRGRLSYSIHDIINEIGTVVLLGGMFTQIYTR